MEVQVLEPARKVMKDEEKIGDHEDRVDGELDQERAESTLLLLLSSG